MFETRDLCWLTKKVQNPGISTWYMDEESDSPISKTIAREMPLLFEDISLSQDPVASIAFSLSSEAETNGSYRIEKTLHGYQVISGSYEGLLYGMFGLHRLLLTGETTLFPYESKPDQTIRMVNHWDNYDGSIERGYAGNSIFYHNNSFRGDTELVLQYSRLLASVGINAVSINNVNVHKLESFFIKDEALTEIKKIAEIFSSYGIKTFLSINFAAPITVGGLTTADPLSMKVESWWKDVISNLYRIIPDFGGLLVKADSEGEPGPFTYGRNHDEGANMLARAIKPFGGLIIWRCFVYDCTQDWRDRSLDRARAAYDIFKDLDGCFEENAILQIKNGPIDFQIREPISPLFGALKKTNQILEFQITQEYTGHQKDICYLVPMWKEVLDFDTRHRDNDLVKHTIKENSPNKSCSGIAAVVNVGMDHNWTGNKLAQANLYGYGRLIWNNELSSQEISEEWTRLSFDLNDGDLRKVSSILTTSRDTYEDYTCPLSVGFMCKPSLHYGPDVDGYEYDKWGTYHYADRDGVGRDRTMATGTGFTRQYSEERCKEYESLETCPDELLLFFHHVPYTHVLHSGKTVIQHIYDTHFNGVEKVKEYQTVWDSLKEVLDEEAYENVKTRLIQQEKNATNWRDQVNTYFYRKSGIEDERGRRIFD